MEVRQYQKEDGAKGVLILIIMEDTHGGIGFADGTKALLSVLILIIMEDTLGAQNL